ncbi:MAG: prolipoprotein diacylglyceryl transferase family protein [Anaerolineales bacterium]
MSAFPWVFTLGILLGMIWLVLQYSASSSGSDDADLLPAAVCALGGGLVLARMGFAAAYSGYYLEHPWELLWIWQGGLSGSGGLIGAVVGLWFYARFSPLQLPHLVDRLALPGLIVSLSCWIGSWLDGVAYGQPIHSTVPLFTTADMFGTRISRWPAVLLGLIPILGAFILLQRTPPRRRAAGRNGMIGITAIALSILLASLVRADPVPVWLAMRMDTITGLILTIAGGSAYLLSFRTR